MAQLDGVPVGEVLGGGPGGEFAEQGGVGALGVLRLPALMAQVLEEVFDEGLHYSIAIK